VASRYILAKVFATAVVRVVAVSFLVMLWFSFTFVVRQNKMATSNGLPGERSGKPETCVHL
jgi:hypothetical protein